MEVIVGQGIHHSLVVESVPVVGQELNLRSMMLREGRFRVTSVGKMKWGPSEHPHILIERLGDIPEGEEAQHMAVLNC